MFCSNCGNPVNENEKFCPECGTPVECPPQPEAQEIPEMSAIPEQPVPFKPVPTPGQESVQTSAPKKKNTFWIVLSSIMLAAITAAVLLILRPWNKCGPKTPEEIVRASAKKTYDTESLHADVSMQVTIELIASGVSMKMDISTDAEVDAQMNPAVYRMKMNMQMLGQNETVLAYVEQDGEEKKTYISMDDGKTWSMSEDLPVSVPGLNGNGFLSNGFNAENWKMKDIREIGTETVDDAPTTVYAGFLPKELFLENANMEGELPMNLGEGMAEILDQIGDIPMTFWVDNSSGRLLQFRMDLKELMAKVMENRVAQADLSGIGLEINYEVESATVGCKFSQFNEIPPIVVPPEVKKQ